MITDVLPGVSVAVVPPAPEQDVLRTDVAVLLGRTRRGPLGAAVRVQGWAEFQRWYGPDDPAAATPAAVRGFFENGGRTAWVVRVAGAGTAGAAADWVIDDPVPPGFGYGRYRIVATSPGTWANSTRVRIRYQASSVAGPAAVSFRITTPGEPTESFAALPPESIVDRLAGSALIRLVPVGPSLDRTRPARTPAPLVRDWLAVLGGGAEEPPTADDYLAAGELQATLPEPALVGLPDLTDDLPDPVLTETVLALLALVHDGQDRLLVLDVPTAPAGPAPLTAQIALRGGGPEPSGLSADAAVDWVAGLRALGDDALLGCAAVYHPRIQIPAEPGRLRTLPATGHVLGLIARLDGERGPHHTPANAALLEAVDLDPRFPSAQEARLFDGGVNLLRGLPGRGLVVWGGRTLATGAGARYVAHRRLLYQLVRAIRRVADPLVFETNSPELRLALVRGITSVLLAAYRAGALVGARPEEGFQVVCDDTNNPPGQPPEQVVCDVSVAPAAPMEFIRIRVVLGQDRGLEVLEA